MGPYPTACTPGLPKPTWRNPDWRADYDERYAPVPGWGVNPMLACPSTIAVGQAPSSSPPGSAVGGLVVAGSLGMLAMLATRYFGDRGSSSGTTYALAGAAGVGGAIAGSMLAALYCMATIPPATQPTPVGAPTDGDILRCAVALAALATVGAVAGGVLVGRKKGR